MFIRTLGRIFFAARRIAANIAKLPELLRKPPTVLDGPRVVPGIRQGVAAGVAQHVGVNGFAVRFSRYASGPAER